MGHTPRKSGFGQVAPMGVPDPSGRRLLQVHVRFVAAFVTRFAAFVARFAAFVGALYSFAIAATASRSTSCVTGKPTVRASASLMSSVGLMFGFKPRFKRSAFMRSATNA